MGLNMYFIQASVVFGINSFNLILLQRHEADSFKRLCSNRIRTVVAMVTNSFHILILGKLEIGNICNLKEVF